MHHGYKHYYITLVHPYSMMFWWYQEHIKRCHGLGDLDMTNKMNKLPSLTNRLFWLSQMWKQHHPKSISCSQNYEIKWNFNHYLHVMKLYDYQTSIPTLALSLPLHHLVHSIQVTIEMHVSLTTNSNSHIQSQGAKEQIEDLNEVVSPCIEWQ